jgi:hypothetical protein
MDNKLNSGVLIIGSLLWQDYTHEKGDNIRLNWRNTRLSLADKIAVKIPIRYGRLSGSKNSKVPTMIFSNKMQNKLGIGYVVPFKSVINNYDQLLCEAMELSVAEGMMGNFVKDWGVLAYLVNENKINKETKKEIIKLFKQRKNQQFIPKEYKVGREKSCVTSSLKLDINWPQALIPSDQIKLNQFDFVLGTATNPKNEVVTIDTIAKKIAADKDRRYFLNNISNGIITYEDFDIAKKIK